MIQLLPKRCHTPSHRSFLVLKQSAVVCCTVVVSGLFLDLAQLVAWGAMWANNLQTEALLTSFSKTFEKEERCSLCHAIEEVRQEDEGHTQGTWIGKVLLLLWNFRLIGWLPDIDDSRLLETLPAKLQNLPKRPLLPPPRSIIT